MNKNALNGLLIFVGLAIFGVILVFQAINYFDDKYVEQHNKCILDCERAGQEFLITKII